MVEGYINRSIKNAFKELSSAFPVVLITGARQVGKSTFLLNQVEAARQYVTLDNPKIRYLAQNDPESFLELYPAPIIIDEIQYAPELFPYLKIMVDQEQKAGQYWLTGSQMFRMMQGVSESLAGRVGLLNLYSLSLREIAGLLGAPFLPGNWNKPTPDMLLPDVYKRIVRGGMPKLEQAGQLSPERYFSSYFQTYIERDIRELIRIENEGKFVRFISLVAARTGMELVYDHLANEAQIDIKTAQSWLSLLVTSGLVYLLQPYANNAVKRIIKRPKIVFMDTGLAAYLAHWSDAATLEVSAASGFFFETLVLSEIIKSYAHHGLDPASKLFYYRDDRQREIDLLIIQNGTVYPVEIKKHSNPGADALRHFSVIESFGLKRGTGAVICNSKELLPMTQTDWMVPLSYL
ncbi:MAG: ATP-binding protein [Christensenellales bacterium]